MTGAAAAKIHLIVDDHRGLSCPLHHLRRLTGLPGKELIADELEEPTG